MTYFHYASKNKSDKEIEEVMNKCAEATERGRSKWPGMTYEQGVDAAINWLLDTGFDDIHPFEE